MNATTWALLTVAAGSLLFLAAGAGSGPENEVAAIPGFERPSAARACAGGASEDHAPAEVERIAASGGQRGSREHLDASTGAATATPPAAERHAGAISRARRAEIAAALAISDASERARRLGTVAWAAQDAAELEAAILPLAREKPEAAFEVLVAHLRRGPGPLFDAAFDLAAGVHSTLALTAGAEMLNSDLPAPIKIAAGEALVRLVREYPHLEGPTVSTLRYAQETNPDGTVQQALAANVETIRREIAQRERPDEAAGAGSGEE